eukprot:Opistho-2@77543
MARTAPTLTPHSPSRIEGRQPLHPSADNGAGGGHSRIRSLLLLGVIFGGAAASLQLVLSRFPALEGEDAERFKFPRSLDDAKGLSLVLSRYTDSHFGTVWTDYVFTYVFLQTFAIPGSIFLSFLSGSLFSFPLALFTVCLCSAVGASNCYILSSLVGRGLVERYFPDRVKSWREQLQRHKGELLNYILFLRITPFLPNWFINVASPVIGVPIFHFFVGTFLGVAPPSFVAVNLGRTIHQLTSTSLPLSTVVSLIAVGFVALVPVVFKDSLRKKLQ